MFQIISYLVSQFQDTEGPLMTAFKEGSIAAAISHMTEPDMSSAIVLALTELCITRDPLTYTGTYVPLGMYPPGHVSPWACIPLGMCPPRHVSP